VVHVLIGFALSTVPSWAEAAWLRQALMTTASNTNVIRFISSPFKGSIFRASWTGRLTIETKYLKGRHAYLSHPNNCRCGLHKLRLPLVQFVSLSAKPIGFETGHPPPSCR